MTTKNASAGAVATQDRTCKPAAPSGMVEIEPGLYTARKSTSIFTNEEEDDEDEGVESVEPKKK